MLINLQETTSTSLLMAWSGKLVSQSSFLKSDIADLIAVLGANFWQ